MTMSDVSSPGFLPFESSWSLPNGFGSGELDPAPGLPSELGHHQVAFQPMSEGCGLFRAQLNLNRPVLITGTVISPAPFLLLRVPLAGRAKVELQGDRVIDETPEGCGLYLHARLGRTCCIEQKSDEFGDVIAPMISVDRLRLMLDGLRLPAIMERFLDGRGDDFVATLKMSAAMRYLGQQLQASPYAGDLGNLYRQGKLLELLAGILSDLDDTTPAHRRISRAEQAQVATVCDMLRLDLAHPPTLEALAYYVGLPQRRLSEVFREITDMTIPHWIMHERLAVAADYLQKGDLPIKEIAHRLGYSQVSSFTAAFSRRYGCPPAEYRKALVSVHPVVNAK